MPVVTPAPVITTPLFSRIMKSSSFDLPRHGVETGFIELGTVQEWICLYDKFLLTHDADAAWLSIYYGRCLRDIALGNMPGHVVVHPVAKRQAELWLSEQLGEIDFFKPTVK